MPAPTTSTMPPPSTFAFLPPLHPLLLRLLVPTDSPLAENEPQPLSPKDLPALTSPIHQKIQKARLMVSQMEGIETGLEEQEDMLKELEEEVRRGEGVLRKLKLDARDVLEGKGDEDEEPRGEEGMEGLRGGEEAG